MHDVGVIHNDLHASNIVYRVNKDGEYDYAIIDFGLSLYFKNKNIILNKHMITTERSLRYFYPPCDYYKLQESIEKHSIQKLFLLHFIQHNYLHPADYIFIDRIYFYLYNKKFIDIYDFMKEYIKHNKKHIEPYIKGSYLEQLFKKKYVKDDFFTKSTYKLKLISSSSKLKPKTKPNTKPKKIKVKEIGNPTKIAKSITPTKIKPKIAGSINSAIIYLLLAIHPF